MNQKHTVLLTGTAGFIGNHTAHKLLQDNYKVIGVDNFNEYYDVTLKHNRIKRLKEYTDTEQFINYNCDLTDNAGLNKIFEDHKPDYVINLAAQAGVRYSLEAPQVYINSNVTGFTNILECCRYHNIQHVIYASTSSVYGANTQLPFNTGHHTEHPITLYAATKKANEMMAHSYSHLFGIPSTGLRFFTVYGPWGRPDMALFKFTKAILEQKPIDIYNHGNMSRDFTYVQDIVENIVRLLPHRPSIDSNWDSSNPNPDTSSVAPYRILNIGNNRQTKLLDYIQAIEDKLGIEAQKNFMPMQMGDVPNTWADIEKLYAITGHRPNTDVKTGINNFIDWYREYYAC